MCIIFTGLLFHESEIQKIFFFFFFNSRITFERKHLEFCVVHLIWTTQDRTCVNCTHVKSRKISEIHKHEKRGNYAEFKSWKNGWMCIIFTSLSLHKWENSNVEQNILEALCCPPHQTMQDRTCEWQPLRNMKDF